MQRIKWVFCTLMMLVGLMGAPATFAADTGSEINAAPVVNINQAGAAELAEALSGVGQKKAEAIVQFRDEHGDFLSLSGLTRVKGIGDATVDKNRDRIRLE